jgi:hypothetical protein
MLKKCMEEVNTNFVISSPLLERDMHHIIRRKCTGREFKMVVDLWSYDMDDVMVDLGSIINILKNKY